jgi:Flp pilus assembly protein TadG
VRAAWRVPLAQRRVRRAGERGQSLVEFSFVVPVFLLLLLGMLEFGFAFEHDQTLAYATREGARVGAAEGDGSTGNPCNAGTAAAFDAPIIAAVERTLTSPGSPIELAQVSSIHVYKAQANGTETAGKVNIWTPATAQGPVVDGKALDFKQTTVGWACTARQVGATPSAVDALGVSITYTYQMRTSLGGIVRFMFGSNWSSLPMTDKTVMTLNPTN